MTKEEFGRKYRPAMLLFLTEAWACRKLPPSELGLLIDQQSIQVRYMLSEMYDALVPKPPAAESARVNGKAEAKK